MPDPTGPRRRLTPAQYARARAENHTDAELQAQGFDLPNGPPGGQVAVNDTLGAAQGQTPKSANRRQLTHAEYNRAVNGIDLSGRYGDKHTDDELRAQGYDLPDVGGGRMAANAGLGAAEGVTLGNAAELYGAGAAAAGARREREPGDLWGTMAGRVPERQNPSPDRNPKPPSLSDLYISKRDEARDRIATARRESPLVTGGSEFVAGLIAPGGVAIKGYRTAKAAQALNKLSPLRQALEIAKGTGKAAGKVGAVQGGVYGLGQSGEDTRGGITNPLSQVMDMLVGAGVGSTVGAGLGGAIPLVVPVGKALGGVYKGAVRKLGVTTAKSRAATNAQRFLDEIQAAGSSPENVVAREQKILSQGRLSAPAENPGTALDAMGPAGVTLVNRLGPVNSETAGLLNNAAQTYSVRHPLRQVLIKAAKNRSPASSLAEDVLSDGVIGTAIAGKTGGLVAGIKNAVGAGTRRSELNENLDLVRSLLDPVDGGTLQRILPPDPTTKTPGVLGRILMKLRGTPEALPKTLARPGFRNDPYKQVLKEKQLLEQTAVDDFFNPRTGDKEKQLLEQTAVDDFFNPRTGDGGGGAAVVLPAPPVVPSSPSVVTPSETLTQAQAQQQARTPWNTKTEEELQSKTAEYLDLFNQAPTDIIAANPGFKERWLAADPSVRQHIAYRLKYDLGAAEGFAKQAKKRATLETANTTPILKREHHASDYFGDYDRAMEYIRDNNLPFVPQGNFKTPGSINHALDALGLNPHHRASAEDIARITASERIARDGSDVSGRVGPSAFPDPTMAATQMMSSMSGGIGGGAYGATQGDTPRERLRNMLLYGVAGVTGGAVAPKMVRSMVKMAGNEIGTLGPRARAIADGLSTPGKVVRPPASGYFKKPEAGHTKSTSMPSPGKIRQRLSDAEGHVTWLEQNAQEPFKRTWENVFSPEGFDPTFRMKRGINTMPEAQGKPNPLIDELMGLRRFEALHKRQAALGLPRGGLEWYNLKPIANSYDDMPGNFIFEDFSQAGSAGSVQRGVPMEISNASILLFAKRNGITPKEAVEVMMKQYPMSQGTGLMPVHGTLFDKYQTTGAINPSSPTAGTRKVAGFSRGKLGESVDPSTPGPSRVALDTHDQKATLFPLGLEGYMDKLTAKEYDQIGQNYKRLASQMGLPDETTFQAGRWIGGGPMTGLRSPSGDYMETLAGMLLETARKTGKDTSPAGLRKLWRDVAQGNDFLLPYYGKGPPGR